MPIMGPYPEPDKSSQWTPSYFCKIYFNTSSQLLLGLPSGPFPSGFPTKTLYLYSNNECIALLRVTLSPCTPIRHMEEWRFTPLNLNLDTSN